MFKNASKISLFFIWDFGIFLASWKILHILIYITTVFKSSFCPLSKKSFVFGSCAFVKGGKILFFTNRTCGAKRRTPKSKPEVMSRLCPCTIPAYFSRKQAIWLLFHQNRSRITRVIMGTNLGHSAQSTAYGLHLNTNPLPPLPLKSAKTRCGTYNPCKKICLG